MQGGARLREELAAGDVQLVVAVGEEGALGGGAGGGVEEGHAGQDGYIFEYLEE